MQYFLERTDAINDSQYRRGSSSIFQPVAHRERRFGPSVLSGGWYRKIFHEYANKGQARREGSGKRAHRRFYTSKRIWSGFTQPIVVEFDELGAFGLASLSQSCATNQAALTGKKARDGGA